MAECWITLDKNSASKDSIVRISYGLNTTGKQRSATVEVKSPDGNIVKQYRIAQDEQVLVGNDLRTKSCTRICDEGGTSSSETVRVEPGTFHAETKEEANKLADAELLKKCEEISSTLTCTWTNDEITRPVQKNDCLVTKEGSFVEWTVPADKYSSTISKSDANAKAEAEFGPDGAGQNNANIHGTCTTTTWYNEEFRKSYPVTKCEEHFTPVPAEVEYVVPAGKYSWTVGMEPIDGLTGQEAANKKAENEAEADGPSNANLPDNSTCEEDGAFYGVYEETFTRSDCAEHFHSPTLTINQYTEGLEGKPFKSYESQEAANELAKAAVQAYGQAKIMEMDCIEDPKWVGVYSQSFTKTCAEDGTGSSITINETMVEGYPESVTSYESEAVANGLAEAAVKAQGQALADADPSGTCTWIGSYEKQFQRDNCEENMVGSFVKVNSTMTTGYPANSTSTVSKADANTKAQAAVEEQGQGIANAQGTCEEGTIYYGVATQELTRANCPTCQKGTKIYVTSDLVFGVNKFPSTESQEAADALALAAMNEESEIAGVTKAQAWVNKNGECDEDPALTSNPTWEDTGDTECRDGVSFKKQTNTNECYTGADQERWIEGGNRQCSWTGTASKAFTPACASSYNGQTHNGTPSGNITITQADVTGGPFTSTVSQDDANAKAMAAVNAQGQALADQRAISSGMCTWTAVYSKTYTKDNCGSCKIPSSACSNQTITSTQVNSGNPVSSTVSYEDAYNKAVNTLTKQTEGKEAGQAYINKNCGDCIDDNLSPNWVLDSSTYVCNGCSSARLYRDNNPCSGSYNTTKYINEGSKDCSTNGTWSNSSSTRCSGCSSEVYQNNSCGGTRWTSGGGRNCSSNGSWGNWSYYCSGTTRYRTRTNTCGATEDEVYEYNSVTCGYDPCDAIGNDCQKTGAYICEKSGGYRTGYVYYDYESPSGCANCDSLAYQKVYNTYLCGCETPVCESGYSCVDGVSKRRCIDMCGNETWITEGTACSATVQCYTFNGQSCAGTDCTCALSGCSGSKTANAATTAAATTAAQDACKNACSKTYTHRRETVVSDAKCREVCPSGNGTSKGVNAITTGTGSSCSEAGTQSWNNYLSDIGNNPTKYCNCSSTSGTLVIVLKTSTPFKTLCSKNNPRIVFYHIDDTTHSHLAPVNGNLGDQVFLMLLPIGGYNMNFMTDHNSSDGNSHVWLVNKLATIGCDKTNLHYDNRCITIRGNSTNNPAGSFVIQNGQTTTVYVEMTCSL